MQTKQAETELIAETRKQIHETFKDMDCAIVMNRQRQRCLNLAVWHDHKFNLIGRVTLPITMEEVGKLRQAFIDGKNCDEP